MVKHILRFTCKETTSRTHEAFTMRVFRSLHMEEGDLSTLRYIMKMANKLK